MLVPRIVHNVTRRIFPPAGHETTLQHEILPAGWMQSPWLALHFLHLFVGMCIPVITCTNNYITYIVAMWLYIVAMWLYFGRSRLQCEMAENQRVNSQTAEESQFKFWPAVTAVTMEVYGSDTPQVVSTVVSCIHALCFAKLELVESVGGAYMRDLMFYLANTPPLLVPCLDVGHRNIILQTNRNWFNTGLPSLLSSSRNPNTFWSRLVGHSV